MAASFAWDSLRSFRWWAMFWPRGLLGMSMGGCSSLDEARTSMGVERIFMAE